MGDSKIQMKIGSIEFAGEGEQEWLTQQLDKVLDKIPELLKVDVANSPKSAAVNNESGDNKGVSAISGLSVLNIAGKLGSKSGSDLAIAATAYLHFIEGKSAFTRDDISSAMKKATGIYKDSYLSNLTSYLSQLEKGGTFLKSGTTYSLNASKVSELHGILSK